MRAVDTNVIVRLLTGDGGAQVAAAEDFVSPGAWVPHIALAEAAWVLQSVYKVSHRELVAAIDLLLDHAVLVLQEADVVQEAMDDFRSHPKLSFSDCLILAVARKAGHLPLGTFDRELAKQPGAAPV